MTLAREVDILTAARDQIKKGYTNQAYVGVRNGGVNQAHSEQSYLKLLEKENTRPVVCAIGGVEHALYKTTGQFIKERLRQEWFRIGTEYEGLHLGKTQEQMNRLRNEVSILYAKCLFRLNKLAIEEGYPHIEYPNTNMKPSESKPIILRIYAKAIKQAQAEADAQMEQELSDILATRAPRKKVAVPA